MEFNLRKECTPVFGEQIIQTQNGPSESYPRAACNTRAMTLHIPPNERFVRIEKSVSCAFAKRLLTSTLPRHYRFVFSLSPDFSSSTRCNPFKNHRLTMNSLRHTIPHGPQFKLLFNIPIFD